MNAKLLARLERAEVQFPPIVHHWDMSGLTERELEILESLPATEAELCAVIYAPDYDFIGLALIVRRLQRGQ
ncbi:hypothetical protein [Sphingomonas faeni]|uniref:hypothetical protein n=1 Tax=Sphingomonas faeni TaxID=185950 RepID=UPI0020C16DF4|nr:hypothetical protein [Sphingomonas faeni]MCK8457029.1 hypothetical protein [Sphingomonas faeni]